jgi:hypothetical protein
MAGAPFSASASAYAPAESPPPLPCRQTPLHWAAANGASDAIAELLMRGADGAANSARG